MQPELNSQLNIVIALKDPEKAKQRLKPLLNQSEREQLVLVLFKQTLMTLRQHCPELHVLVVTPSTVVETIARSFGVSVLMEKKAGGLTAAIEQATQWSVAHGYDSQLVIPPDLAYLDVNELNQLLACPRPESSVFVCPAKDFGSNAVLTTPPDVIDFWFGHRSYFEYQRRAKQNNSTFQSFSLDHMAFDIDTPEDVALWLSRQNEATGDHSLNQMLQRKVVA